MSIYYIENQNGTYHSEDNVRHFSKLSGAEAYEYLKTPEGSVKHFMRANDYEDGGEDVFVEIPESYIKKHLVSKRHEQYLNDCKKNSEYTLVSLYAISDSGGDTEMISGEELIADESMDVFEIVNNRINLERLREALTHLNPKERELLRCFYFGEHSYSEREYAEQFGLPCMTVHNRKQAVLRKLRNFLKNQK